MVRGIADHYCAQTGCDNRGDSTTAVPPCRTAQLTGSDQANTQSGSASGTRISLTLLYRSLANLSRMAAVLLCRASRRAWYSSRTAGASWPGV